VTGFSFRDFSKGLSPRGATFGCSVMLGSTVAAGAAAVMLAGSEAACTAAACVADMVVACAEVAAAAAEASVLPARVCPAAVMGAIAFRLADNAGCWEVMPVVARGSGFSVTSGFG